MTVIKYRGWEIKVYKHVVFPPYKGWNASCWRKDGKKMKMFNCEALSEKQAINIAKDMIDER